MELKELLNALNQLSRDIRRVSKAVQYDEYGDGNMEGVRRDFFDADDLFLYDELCAVMRHLSKAADDVEYLKTPFRNEGRLRKNPSGYYAFPDGEELHCGHGVEILAADDAHEQYVNGEYIPTPYWKAGRIEHDGDDYYFTGSRTTPLEGVRARTRY